VNKLSSSDIDLDVGADSRWIVTLEWLLTVAAAAFQVFIAPHEIWGDGWIRYQTLIKLVDESTVSPACYSIVHTLLAVPLYALGKVFGRGSEFASYFNVILFDLTLLLLYRMLRRHMPAAVLRRTILLLVAASMFGNSVQTFYGEVLTACAAMLGISALALNRPTIAGVAMCISVVNTPAAALGLALCNGWWALRTRRWFQAAWPLFVSAALIALEFWWRRGSPFRSGYEGVRGIKTFMPYSGLPGFSYPLLLGVLSLLFSFGRGILIYAPGLLLHYVPTPAKHAPVQSMLGQLCAAFFWGLLLAYSTWWCWYGAWCWGPRFLLFACMPASLALAQHVTYTRHRHVVVTLLTAFAVIWSTWVGVNGTVIREIETEPCMSNDFNFEAICLFVPEFTPLIHPLIKPKPMSPWDRRAMYLATGVVIVLLVPMLSNRLRNFAVRTLSNNR